MREIPDPIQWYEGMLLMPQHFQQLAGRYESLISYTIAQAGSSHPWGFIDLEYEIRDGILSVSRVKAIMPDGYVVEREAEEPLKLDLKEAGQQTGTASFMAHLTVPKQPSLSTNGELARYASYEGDPVADENSGDGAITMPRLRAKLELWACDQPPIRLQSLPIARLYAGGGGVWEKDEDFAPPFLRVDPSSALGRKCGEIVELIRSKCNALSDQLRTRTVEQVEEAIELRLKTHTLAAGIPPVEAALDAGACHPFSLYLLMCALSGQVAAVTSGSMSPRYPKYRHADPLGSFAPVLMFIRDAVSMTATRWWEALRFRVIEGGFEAPNGPTLNEALKAAGRLDRPTIAIALRVPVATTEAMVAGWLEAAVIGGSSAMPELQAKRVPGAARKRVERLEGLAPPPETVLFAIAPEPGTMSPGDAVQIVEMFRNEGRPTEAILFVRRDTAKAEQKATGGN